MKEFAIGVRAAILDTAPSKAIYRSTGKPIATSMFINGMLDKREEQEAARTSKDAVFSSRIPPTKPHTEMASHLSTPLVLPNDGKVVSHSTCSTCER